MIILVTSALAHRLTVPHNHNDLLLTMRYLEELVKIMHSLSGERTLPVVPLGKRRKSLVCWKANGKQNKHFPLVSKRVSLHGCLAKKAPR